MSDLVLKAHARGSILDIFDLAVLWTDGERLYFVEWGHGRASCAIYAQEDRPLYHYHYASFERLASGARIPLGRWRQVHAWTDREITPKALFDDPLSYFVRQAL